MGQPRKRTPWRASRRCRALESRCGALSSRTWSLARKRIFLARSNDLGLTWSPAERLNTIGGTKIVPSHVRPVLATAIHGKCVVAWSAQYVDSIYSNVFAANSQDNGTTWGNTTHVFPGCSRGRTTTWSLTLQPTARGTGCSVASLQHIPMEITGLIMTSMWLCRRTLAQLGAP